MSRLRPLAIARFGLLGAVLAFGPSAPGQEPGAAPLARYVPRQDLLALIEFDGLDAHEAAWKKTAASKLLNETTLGVLLEDLAAQGFDKVLSALPGGLRPKGSDGVASIEQLAEKGLVLGVVGRLPAEPGVVVVARGAGTGTIRKLYDQARAAMVPPGAEGPKEGRTLFKVGSASIWIEGEDLIFVDSEPLAAQVVDAIEGKAQNATSHAIRVELVRPEADFEPVLRAFLDPALLPPLPPQARGLGLDGIKRVDVRWGFQDDALMSVVRVIAPKPRRGVVALFDQPAFPRGILPPLPADLHGFTAVSVDPEVTFGRIVNAFAVADKSFPEKAARFEAAFQQATGLGLREDLLKNLGPKMALYMTDPRAGGGIPIAPGMLAQIPEITILAQVDDPAGFGKSVDRLMAFANKALAESRQADPNAPEIAFRKVDGPQTAYSLELPPGAVPIPGFEPTLFVAKGYLIVSTSSEGANRAARVVSGGEKPWTPTGAFEAMAGRLPSGLIALNVNDPRDTLPKLITSLPDLSEKLGGLVGGGRPGAGPLVKVNRALVPDEAAMEKILFPGSFAVAVDDQAIRLVGRSSFPSVTTPAAGGLMVGLMLPAVQAAREAARRAQCANDLRQIGLAIRNFEAANNTFPAASIAGKDGKPLLSWRVAILPYLDQNDLYNKFHLDEPWDSPNNRPLIAEMPGLFACPSDPGDRKARGLTGYRVYVGNGAAFETAKGARIADFLDGTSNTILVVESKDQVAWTKPDELAFPAAVDAPFPKPKSNHPGGFNALFADGAVRFLKDTIDQATLRALITRASGEVINLEALQPR